MRLYTIVSAILSATLALGASPDAHSLRHRAPPPPPCNKDFSPEACGACHYWRECLDSRTHEWITPCPKCDNTSWCNCTAPPDHNGMMQRFVF